jgi:transcriptional accessory protein Tex/SPT6
MSEHTSPLEESEKETVEEKFQRDRNSWTKKVIEMSESYRNINNVSSTLVDLHSKRQELLEHVFKLGKVNAKLLSKMNMTKAVELKKLTDTHSANYSDYRYSEKERDKIIESSISEIKYQHSLVTSQLEFFKETIKTIDNLLWNTRYIVDLEKIRFQ